MIIRHLYSGGGGTIDKPNVSLVTDNGSINYNPENNVPNNEIWYKTGNGKIVEYVRVTGFTDAEGVSATLTNHTYADGIGKIVFDRDIAVVPLKAFKIRDTDMAEEMLGQSATADDGTSVQSLIRPAEDDADWADITRIWLPKSIVTLPPDLYQYMGIENIVIAESVRNLDGWDVSLNLTNIKSISVEAGNTKFWSMTNCVVDAETGEIVVALDTAQIPAGVVTIPNQMFVGYERDAIVIPDTVTTIGRVAFARCFRVTEIIIGSGVTTIGNSAFRAIPNLKTVTVNAVTPPSYDTGADSEDEASKSPMFNESTKLESIYVPRESLSLYEAADGWKEYASKFRSIGGGGGMIPEGGM